MRNVSTNVVGKIKHTFNSNRLLFRKMYNLWENVEKYCRAWQDTDDNIAQAHYNLRSSGYRHTLRICKTQQFSIATTDARKRLTVYIYVRCLPCRHQYFVRDVYKAGNIYIYIYISPMMDQQKLKHAGGLIIWIITRKAMNECKVKARSCNNCCRWKNKNITYSQCVFVSSIQCVCANCYLWPVWLYKIFPLYLTKKSMIWEKNIIEHEISVLILSLKFISNISHSMEKWERYDQKYRLVFIWGSC